MILKRIVSTAAILIMIPTGLAFAMPGTVPGTAVEFKAETYDYTKDAFFSWCGWWGEKAADRAMITITTGEKGWYGVEICWRRNASQVDMWTMSAEPAGKDVMEYKDCIHSLLTYKDGAIDKEEILYKNGTGAITVNSAKEMTWRDDQDHIADKIVYVKLNRPLGGGL
ncbi:MAG: hypothetical protein IKZ43_01685 [Acidaminococcaceae bacterium]|nr:hypothetical protein [Acidaminococcaceae bacterium]